VGPFEKLGAYDEVVVEYIAPYFLMSSTLVVYFAQNME
jgi:hypothetical protein